MKIPYLRTTVLGPLLLLAACQTAVPPASDQWLPVAGDGSVLTLDELGQHACVLDRRTGLMWQVASERSEIHRPRDTFTWHDLNRDGNLGEPGLPGGGECSLAQCDTSALASAVNAQGLCGHRDWFVPGREQLMTLVDRRHVDDGQVLDRRFFPEDPAGEFWSGSSFRLYPQSAWVVDTRVGLDRAELKTEPRHVRLVRRHALPQHMENKK